MSMRYLLDTDTCVHILRGNTAFIDALSELPAIEVGISVITQYELQFGIAKASQAQKKKQENLHTLLHSITLCPFDGGALEAAVQIRASLERLGQPIGSYDYLIAGTAKSHRATLLTENLKEFRKVKGLKAKSLLEA